MISKLGFGAPGASALRKDTKRFRKAVEAKQQQQHEELKKLSLIEFTDNIENFRRKHCRARKNKRFAPYKSRMIRIPLYVPSTNKFFQAQFTSPLRQDPLPTLTMADFESSAEGKAAHLQFREQCVTKTLALVLTSPADPVRRQLTIKSALHTDGLAAKTCVSPTCRERFSRLYNSTKRICQVLVPLTAVWLLIVLFATGCLLQAAAAQARFVRADRRGPTWPS